MTVFRPPVLVISVFPVPYNIEVLLLSYPLPHLFIIYINDMPDSSTCSPTTRYFTVFLKDLKVLNDWLATNKLKLNTSKTKRMLINYKPVEDDETVVLKIQEAELDKVTLFKYLGVIIDDN